MRPFHIQVDFHAPIGICSRFASGRIHFSEEAICDGASGQVELAAEHAQVRFDIGVIIGVHNTDDLAGSLVLYEIETASMADLRRRKTIR